MKCYGVHKIARFIHYGCWCGPLRPSAWKGSYNSTIDPVDDIDKYVLSLISDVGAGGTGNAAASP